MIVEQIASISVRGFHLVGSSLRLAPESTERSDWWNGGRFGAIARLLA